MKTAKPFGKAAEAKLMGAVKEMTAHVEENGCSPDEAIAKVASEHGLSADWVPLMVQAHNHGRTTYQRDRTDSGVLEKLAEFPLASTEGVMAILYPSEILSPGEEAEKTAVSSEYSRPPTWAEERYKAAESAAILSTPMEKAASAEPVPRDPDGVMRLRMKHISKLAREASRARQDTHRAKMAFLATLGELADWFKGQNVETFVKHAYWAEQLFGAVAKHAMDYVRIRNRLKTAEITAPPPDGQPVTSDYAPYSLVKAAIDAGTTMYFARKKEAEAEVLRKQAHDETFSPFVRAPAKDQSPTSGSASQSSKQSSLLGGVGGGLGFSVARGFSGADKSLEESKSELQQKLVNDLADPSHEQAIRQIQVRAMLTDLLSNDEVISGYDPNEVTEAYNEIASLSPRAAMQPAVVRPLLRKRLTAGSVEPFEAQQMAEIEKTITQTATPAPAKGDSQGVLNGSPMLS